MGYRSQVCAVVSVDMTGRRGTETARVGGTDTIIYKFYHTDEDKALFKELVGKMKLIMGHHLNESFKDDIGWYDYKIVLNCQDTKWYESYDDVKAWTAFWDMAHKMSNDHHISGVFVRSGEDEGDLESLEFGEEPHYDECHTVQDVYMAYATNRRDIDETT